MAHNISHSRCSPSLFNCMLWRTGTICIAMLHSVFELHQEAIRWVNSMICYVEHQAAPSGCLYAFIDLRHLGCDRQVAEYDSPTLSVALVAAASHRLVHNAPAHSRGEEADSEMCSSTPAAARCCVRTPVARCAILVTLQFAENP